MKNMMLAATVVLGSFTFGAPSVSAAPMAVDNLQMGQSGVTQVRMTSNERKMMKKRMMRKKMMQRRMMNRM